MTSDQRTRLRSGELLRGKQGKDEEGIGETESRGIGEIKVKGEPQNIEFRTVEPQKFKGKGKAEEVKRVP